MLFLQQAPKNKPPTSPGFFSWRESHLTVVQTRPQAAAGWISPGRSQGLPPSQMLFSTDLGSTATRGGYYVPPPHPAESGWACDSYDQQNLTEGTLGTSKSRNKRPLGFPLVFGTSDHHAIRLITPRSPSCEEAQAALRSSASGLWARAPAEVLGNKQHQAPDAKLKLPSEGSSSQTSGTEDAAFSVEAQTSHPHRVLATFLTHKVCEQNKKCRFMPLTFATVCCAALVTGTHCLDD